MDEADYAAEAQHAFVEAAIAAVVSRATDDLSAAGRTPCTCIACGEPIPRLRRLALPGCRHCIDCAHAQEAHARCYRPTALGGSRDADS